MAVNVYQKSFRASKYLIEITRITPTRVHAVALDNKNWEKGTKLAFENGRTWGFETV